jgi:hypothetical protein
MPTQRAKVRFSYRLADVAYAKQSSGDANQTSFELQLNSDMALWRVGGLET